MVVVVGVKGGSGRELGIASIFMVGVAGDPSDVLPGRRRLHVVGACNFM